MFPLSAFIPHAQGSSGVVATMPFVWRGRTKSPTTRAGRVLDLDITQAPSLEALLWEHGVDLTVAHGDGQNHVQASRFSRLIPGTTILGTAVLWGA